MQFFLELKEKLKYFYSRYDRLLIAVCKFVFLFVLLTVIEKNTGYCTLIDKPVILHLALALVCSVAPSGFLSVVGCGYLVLQLWYTSREAAIVLGMMYFVSFCLFFVFHPGNSHLTVLTLLFSFWKMPAAVWVVAGMVTNPFATIPVVFGLVIQDYLEFVRNNLSTLTSAKTVLTMPERLIFLINGIIRNDSHWILFFVAFLTIGISFIVRKIPVKYSWIVGAVTSAVCSMLFTILGGYLFEIHVDVLSCVIGSLLGLAFLMVYYFLVYSLNYERMELVQFEDEDYVYYVKAIPKTSLPKQQISFKTFAKRGKPQKDETEEATSSGAEEDAPVKTEVVSSGKLSDTGVLPDTSGDLSADGDNAEDAFATRPIEPIRKEVKSASELGNTAPVYLNEQEEPKATEESEEPIESDPEFESPEEMNPDSEKEDRPDSERTDESDSEKTDEMDPEGTDGFDSEKNDEWNAPEEESFGQEEEKKSSEEE